MTTERMPYWIGQVYIVDGKCYATDVRRKVSVQGSSFSAVAVCLGKEEDIVPILGGEKAIDALPNDTDGYRRSVLMRVLEEDGVVTASESGNGSVERRGSTKASRDRAKDPRQAAAGKRLAIR